MVLFKASILGYDFYFLQVVRRYGGPFQIDQLANGDVDLGS